MTRFEFRAITWIGLFGTLIWLFYMMFNTPMPRFEFHILTAVVGGWLVGRVWSYRAQWRPELRQMWYISLYFILAVALVYFGVRLLVGPIIAVVAAGLVAFYLASTYFIGGVLILNERYAEAHRFFDRILKLFPNDSKLHTQRAYTYFLQEHFEQAIESATHAIALHTKSSVKMAATVTEDTAQAYSIRTASYLGLHDGASALYDAEILVRSIPKDPSVFLNRGTALLYLDRFKAAQADFERVFALPLTPYQRGITENNMGLAAYCLHDYDTAIDYYQRALEESVSSFERRALLPLVYGNLVTLYFSQANTTAAWDAIRAAAGVDPHSLETRTHMAVMHHFANEWDQALEIWHTLIAEDQRFLDADVTKERFYRWTPEMAALVDQIIDRLELTQA